MRLEMTGGKGIYRRNLNTNVTEVGDTENKLRWYCKPNIIHGALFLLGYYSFFKIPLPIYLGHQIPKFCSLMCYCCMTIV